MATTLFTQNTIACIWDFDKTLIPDYMQSPLFRRYGIDEATFWEETNKLAEHYKRYVNEQYRFIFVGKTDATPKYFAAIQALIVDWSARLSAATRRAEALVGRAH